MARIAGGNDITVVQIRAFLGLDENPDGETALKMGEFGRMWNFRITKDGHLQKRPGAKRVLCVYKGAGAGETPKEEVPGGWETPGGEEGPGDQAELFAAPGYGGETPEIPPAYPEDTARGPIDRADPRYPETFPDDPVTGEAVHLFGAWHGMVGGRAHTIANYDGYILDMDLAESRAEVVGWAATDTTRFFGFGDKVYVLDGASYQVWDGSAVDEDGKGGFAPVEGYVPLIQTATTPEGSGTLLENVNRLNGKRRVEFSPDGAAATFHLPEKDIGAVIAVKLAGKSGTPVYTVDEGAGTVTLNEIPPEGTNTLEITYQKGVGAPEEVMRMRCAELFNGAADTRVFLYGDGSNRAIYSGVEYASGQPSAEYFPDLAEVSVGERNTPLTALVRHYSRLMAYKPGSAWVVTAGSFTTQSDRMTAAFYVAPVNRQTGNQAMGQVRLLENDPVTFDVGGVYQWKNANGYISNSENNAKRISDRVMATLRGFDVSKIRTFNIRQDYEFWILYGNDALIYNYGNDTWYFYRDLAFHDLLEVDGQLYGLSNDGNVVRVSRAYPNDCGRVIDCYAETGAMDFGRDWQLKYSPMLFVAIRPELQARVYVTVESNRRSGYPDKLVSANLSTFEHVNFAHFSFVTNRKPQVRRLRLKVKKAAFYKIIYKSSDKDATCTVIETDVRLRYAGTVK